MSFHDAPPFVWIGFVVVAALVGLGFYTAWIGEKKRTAALFDVAVHMGFTFEDKVPKEMGPTIAPFRLLTRGYGQKGRNLMRGKTDGVDTVAFDYQYTTGSGKSSHIHRETVVIYTGAAGSGAPLPEFTLGPEHWWEKIGEVFGYQDIDFESSEEFSKHYLLRGSDEGAIRAAFGMNVLGFFAQNLGWSVESAGGSLAVYRAEKRPKPEEMQPFVAEGAAVRRALAHS